jgi:hypothetical protein
MKSRRMRWGGHIAYIEKLRNTYKVLVREAEGKRSVGRSRHRWAYTIKMYLKRSKVGGCGLH